MWQGASCCALVCGLVCGPACPCAHGRCVYPTHVLVGAHRGSQGGSVAPSCACLAYAMVPCLMRMPIA